MVDVDDEVKGTSGLPTQLIGAQTGERREAIQPGGHLIERMGRAGWPRPHGDRW